MSTRGTIYIVVPKLKVNFKCHCDYKQSIAENFYTSIGLGSNDVRLSFTHPGLADKKVCKYLICHVYSRISKKNTYVHTIKSPRGILENS